MLEVHENVQALRERIKIQGVTDKVLEDFSHIIYSHYRNHRRSFYWRDHINPYYVTVSEIMLQQTQTSRVISKFASFVQRFPNFESLAAASLQDVLSEWTGLGYNRRGIALWNIAKRVMSDYSGTMPLDISTLTTFPGIGPNTAGPILAFAYNKPTIFIETNIRTVFIHFFYHDHSSVHDKNIIELVEKTVDHHSPRDWYYALMDYGVLLKQLYPNPSRKSKHYSKQSKFEGSNRQLRSMILQTILKNQHITFEELCTMISKEPYLIKKNVRALEAEGFIKKQHHAYMIA